MGKEYKCFCQWFGRFPVMGSEVHLDIYDDRLTVMNVGEHDGDVSETKLTERQMKILNLIKELPTITAKKMSETLSVSQRTVERDLSALKKKGVLKREGKDYDGLWQILITMG